MNKLKVGINPFFSSNFSTRRIMIDVLIALVPAITVAILFFGANVLLNILICCATAAGCELLFDLQKHGFNKKNFKTSSAWDCSCFVTAVLIALNVPAVIPFWMLILATVLAIIVVKMLFGGIGRNIANPALIARIFLLISFTSIMVSGFSTTAGNLLGMETSTSASWLGTRSPSLVKTGWLDMLIGNKTSAAVGEVSIFALLVGYVYLVVRKVIDWKMPAVIIASVAVFALLFDGLPNAKGADILYLTVGHLINGGLFLGAIFMATDYATSPNTKRGQLVFGVCIGFLTVVLRLFTAMPESVSYAIVLMNLFVPLIDKLLVPKPFGRTKEAKDTAPVSAVNAKKTTAKKAQPVTPGSVVEKAENTETAADKSGDNKNTHAGAAKEAK